MESLLRQAIQCNNAGVDHLEHQNVDVAARAFYEGLCCLQQCTANHLAQDQGVPLEAPISCMHRVFPQAIDHSLVPIPEEYPYFYDRSLLLDETAMTFPDTATTSCDVFMASQEVSCVLLFNYALVYHLQFRRHSKDRFHRNAVKFYQAAMNLLESNINSNENRPLAGAPC